MVGQHVSHYEIISRLGSGGMGEIYQARDHRLGRRVALKFLPRALSRDPRAVERLQREARIASALNHPHICTIHDVDAHDGTHFIVMELLDGLSLTERIRVGPLAAREIVEIAIQVAGAMDAAHRLGVVHRDVKPGNIFLTTNGPVKVLDFGVAKLQPGRPATLSSMPTAFGRALDAAAGTSEQHALTTDGVALGTIQYMSPEQARGEEVDGRSDLFSLGAVLYEMATGTPAFAGPTNALVWDAILNRHPPRPSTVRAGIPPGIEHIVARSLEKDPGRRYQTASELIGDLQRLHRELSGEVPIGRTAEYPTRYVPPALLNAEPPPWPAAAPTPPPPRRWRRAVLPLALALAGLAAAAAYWGARPAALVEDNLIVVGDFDNATGDADFDAALREAVDVQLRQSRWFRVVGEQRTITTLRQMGQPVDTPVVGAVAREVCQRTAAQAVIDGTIAAIGSTYVITLDARLCASGDSLAKEQAQAAGKDGVLQALGAATSRLRTRLGESLQSVERFDTPIVEATTPSLPALKAYSLGVRARVRDGDSAAIPFFRRALELDPAFALAHARLGAVYENLGDRPLAREKAQRAYDLREKVSEYERLYIATRYHDIVTGDLERRIAALRMLGETFPRDFAARNNLGVAYLEAGRLEQAVEQFTQAVAVGPDQRLPTMNLANTLVHLGRFDEAKTAIDRTLAIGDSSDLRAGAYMRAYFAGERAEMERHDEAGRAGGEPWLLAYSRGLVAAYEGRAADARREVGRGIAAAGAARRGGAVARGWLQLAFMDVQLDDPAAARAAAAEALQHDSDARTVLQAATALALAGDARRAATLAAAYDEDRLLDTITREVFVVQARAALALARGDADAAHAMLDRSVGYEPRYPELTWLRGLAHLRAGDPAAAADFRVLLDHPWRGGAVIHPVMELHLARALAAAGDTAGARAAVERFLAAWQRADPGLSLVREARRAAADLTSAS